MRLAAFRHGSAWTQLLESTGRDQQRRRSTRANDLVALDQSLDDRLALRGTPADPTIGWPPRVSPRDADRCTPPDERAHHHSLPDGLPNTLLISWAEYGDILER
jgi:hypothetical protein